MRQVNASEIGGYVFCRRAWSYQQQGNPSRHAGAMKEGWEAHEEHNRKAYRAGCQRTLAYGLLLSSIVLAAAHLINGLIG